MQAAHNYFELQSIKLKTAIVNEGLIDGRKIITGIAPTDTFLNTNIPNNANSRSFTGNKNKSVEEMIKTLKVEPENFITKNLGLRIVASQYIKNGNDLTLFFDEDEGIFNGGHTYQVLTKHGRKNAYVHFIVDLGLHKEQLVDISLALNMSKKLELISQGEKKGAFDWIKASLPDESIRFKEGDVGVYPVDDPLKVANIFRSGKGKQYSVTSLSKSLKNKSAIIKENNEKQVLKDTGYILSDLWDLYKKLKSSEVIQKNLPSKFSRKDELLQGPVLVLLAGVRYMTEINKNNIPLWKEGWNVDKALKVCEKLSKQIGSKVNKAPFSDMKADAIYRDSNFHNIIQVLFAESLLK